MSSSAKGALFITFVLAITALYQGIASAAPYPNGVEIDNCSSYLDLGGVFSDYVDLNCELGYDNDVSTVTDYSSGSTQTDFVFNFTFTKGFGTEANFTMWANHSESGGDNAIISCFNGSSGKYVDFLPDAYSGLFTGDMFGYPNGKTSTIPDDCKLAGDKLSIVAWVSGDGLPFHVYDFNFTVTGIIEPNIVFVSPTPNNQITGNDYAYINLTIKESATCILEWNGVNESMSNLSENYYLNKTALFNGNYTFRAFCDNAAGMNMTEERWVYINRTEWVYSDNWASVQCLRAGTSWTNQAKVWDKDYGTFGYNGGPNQAQGYCQFTFMSIPANLQKMMLQFKIGQSGSVCWQTSNITYPMNCTQSGVTIYRFFSNNDGNGHGYTSVKCRDNTLTYIPIFQCKGELTVDDNIWETNLYLGYGDAPETSPMPPSPAFIAPTPENAIVTDNYTFINITSYPGGFCLLEWNGVNESMTTDYMRGFNVNKTTLGNGNYTFLSYCQDSLGTMNNTETRWVFINYTAPPPAPPIPPSPPVSAQLPLLGFIFSLMGLFIVLGIFDVNVSPKGKEGWKDQLGLVLAVMIGVIVVVLAYSAL
jgi:hypothetical protein